MVAQAYEYFKVRIGRSLLIEAEEIDVSTLTRHCDYDRTKDLVTILSTVAFILTSSINPLFHAFSPSSTSVYSRCCSASGVKTDVPATNFLSSFNFPHSPSNTHKNPFILADHPLSLPFTNTNTFTPTMSWAQTTIRLPSKQRGCHLVTHEIEKQLPELKQFSVGMANVFCKRSISFRHFCSGIPSEKDLD